MLNFFRDNSRIISKLLFYQFGSAFFSGMMILAVPDDSTTLGLVIGIFCALFLVFLNHVVLWEEGATCRLRADAGRAAYNPLCGLYIMLAVNIPNYLLTILYILGSKAGPFAWDAGILKIATAIMMFWESMYVRVMQAIGGSPFLWLLAPVPAILLGFISYWLGLAGCRAFGVFSGPKVEKAKKRK